MRDNNIFDKLESISRQSRGGSGGGEHAPQPDALKVGRVEFGTPTYITSPGTGAASLPAGSPPAHGAGTIPARETKGRTKGRIQKGSHSPAAIAAPLPPRAASPDEAPQVNSELVKERLELAQRLNEIYSEFARNREHKKTDALRILERRLAAIGGSISACGMTGEVKDFVAVLLAFEKVLPQADGGEDAGVSPIDLMSDWLNGKGDLAGEFDAVESK